MLYILGLITTAPLRQKSSCSSRSRTYLRMILPRKARGRLAKKGMVIGLLSSTAQLLTLQTENENSVD